MGIAPKSVLRYIAINRVVLRTYHDILGQCKVKDQTLNDLFNATLEA